PAISIPAAQKLRRRIASAVGKSGKAERDQGQRGKMGHYRVKVLAWLQMNTESARICGPDLFIKRKIRFQRQDHAAIAGKCVYALCPDPQIVGETMFGPKTP